MGEEGSDSARRVAVADLVASVVGSAACTYSGQPFGESVELLWAKELFCFCRYGESENADFSRLPRSHGLFHEDRSKRGCAHTVVSIILFTSAIIECSDSKERSCIRIPWFCC